MGPGTPRNYRVLHLYTSDNVVSIWAVLLTLANDAEGGIVSGKNTACFISSQPQVSQFMDTQLSLRPLSMYQT